MKKFLYLLLASTSLMFNSCTREEDDIELDASKTAYLQQNLWQLTTYEVDPDLYNEQTTLVDQFATLNDCVTDNVWNFNSNTTVELDEYFLKCNINTPQITNLYFSVAGDSYLTVWSNPEDPSASVVLDGAIEQKSHTHFKLIKDVYNEQTGKTTRIVRGYSSFKY